jgi:hypothetical protein
LAYKSFVPSNDLSHGANGRQINVGTEMKPAFRWQIDQDNKNLNDLYHQFLGDLFDYLDECIKNENAESIAAAWTGSAAYKRMKLCFIADASEFDGYYSIESSSSLFHNLVPGMLRIQNRKLKAVLRAELYDKFAEFVLDGKDEADLTADELVIFDLCKLPLALYTMSDAILLFNTMILPDRVVSMSDVSFDGEMQNKLTLKERAAASEFLMVQGDKEMRELQMAVKKYWNEKEGVVYVETPLVNISGDEKFVRL